MGRDVGGGLGWGEDRVRVRCGGRGAHLGGHTQYRREPMFLVGMAGTPAIRSVCLYCFPERMALVTAGERRTQQRNLGSYSNSSKL